MYLLQRPEDIPPRLSGRLNVRIAILTALLIAAIATVLLRLWSLQVLDGQHYRALAQDHGVLDVRVHPRGAGCGSTATAGCWSTTAR